MVILGNVPKKHLKAIDYFADCIFTPQKSKHLTIEVKYKNIETQGEVYIEDYNKRGVPNHFVILVKRSDSEKEKLITIAHELVHVKQYCLGELNEEGTHWLGEYVNVEELEYEELPWEIEAWDVGEYLYQQYVESNNG